MKSLLRYFLEHRNWYDYDDDPKEYWNVITGEMEESAFEYVSGLNIKTWKSTIEFDVKEIISYYRTHTITYNKELRENIYFGIKQLLLCLSKELRRNGSISLDILSKKTLALLGMEFYRKGKAEGDITTSYMEDMEDDQQDKEVEGSQEENDNDILKDVGDDILRKFGNKHTYITFVKNNKGKNPDTVAHEFMKIINEKKIKIDHGDWENLIVPHFQKIKLISIEYSTFLKHIRKYK